LFKKILGLRNRWIVEWLCVLTHCMTKKKKLMLVETPLNSASIISKQYAALRLRLRANWYVSFFCLLITHKLFPFFEQINNYIRCITIPTCTAARDYLHGTIILRVFPEVRTIRAAVNPQSQKNNNNNNNFNSIVCRYTLSCIVFIYTHWVCRKIEFQFIPFYGKNTLSN
jgi:hypothetical protein